MDGDVIRRVTRLAGLAVGLVGLSLVVGTQAAPRGGKGALTVSVLTREGRRLEGTLRNPRLTLTVDGKERPLKLQEVLSLHLADPASPQEAAVIQSGLVAVAGTDRKARDLALESLTDLGLPVLSPLLATYKDLDAREPKPLFRLFERIIPSHADSFDRSQDLVRLADGDALRGEVKGDPLELAPAQGSPVKLSLDQVRTLAVRVASLDRTFDVHSLYHCTQIEYLNSGVMLTPGSHVAVEARVIARMSFDIDGWASDPDGLKKPGPNYKTNLYDGFPFGALLGRVGADGTRWIAGKHAEKSGLGAGHLYLAVNDNPHWQNNVGSYRVRLRVSNAYDVGDAQ